MDDSSTSGKSKGKPVSWRRKALVVAAVAVLGPIGSGVGAVAINRHIQAEGEGRIFDKSAQVPRGYEVALVLGARVWPDGEPSDALEDRLEAARQLYADGKVSKVLVSGDHGAPEYNEVQAMRDWLVKRGVADGHIFMDHAGFRTHDSMQRAAHIFQVKRAVICTQRFHLPRSVWLARQAGVDAVGLVADRRVYRARRFNATREFAARVKAYLDVHVLGTEPRYWGEPIPITGDARRSRG